MKKEDRHKDTGAFRDHLKTNMCNDDEVGSDWLYKLFAWRFQNPNKLPEVGVVLKGLQGSGKDRLMDIMCRIMGSSNDYTHRTEEVGDLFGKFTPALKHKLFVQLNEMEGKAGCDNKEKLKGAITKDVNYINEKNLKPYYLRNLALIIVCSNNLTPVQIPYDCRRWVVYQTGRKNIGNMPFWEWFSALISDDHWIDSVFSELIDEDLTGWRPDDLRLQPKTEAYIAAQEDNIPSLYKYLREIDWDDPRHFTKYEGKSKKLCGKYFVDGKEMWINAKDWIEDEGADRLTGGEGADTITGGGGADQIDLTEVIVAADTVKLGSIAASADTITSFAAGSDKIDLSQALSAATLTIDAQIDSGLELASCVQFEYLLNLR